MQLFEPAETFETNLAEQDPSLQRVGENPPYDSDDQSEGEQKNPALASQSQIEKEYEQISKRGFVARRGRNGQTLLQYMPQSIFHDQESDSEKRQQSTGIVGIDTQKYCKNRVAGVGQNFIIHKFQELMLKKRRRKEMDEMQEEPVPAKKQKRGRGHKDIESSFAESKYLKKYIDQRQFVTGTQKTRYLKSLRKIGLINLSELGK